MSAGRSVGTAAGELACPDRSGEHGEAEQTGPQVVVEEPFGPGDEVAHGAVPGIDVAPARRQHVEVAPDRLGQLGERHRAQPGGGHLEGERQAVDATDELGHEMPVERAVERAGRRRRGALAEQLDGRRVGPGGRQRGRARGRARRRAPAARGSSPARRSRSPLRRSCGTISASGVEDVLAVVEHEQGVDGAGRLEQRPLRAGAAGRGRAAIVDTTPAASSTRASSTTGAPRSYPLRDLAGDVGGQARLADAAGPDERDEAGGAHRGDDVALVVLAPDRRRERRRRDGDDGRGGRVAPAPRRASPAPRARRRADRARARARRRGARSPARRAAAQRLGRTPGPGERPHEDRPRRLAHVVGGDDGLAGRGGLREPARREVGRGRPAPSRRGGPARAGGPRRARPGCRPARRTPGRATPRGRRRASATSPCSRARAQGVVERRCVDRVAGRQHERVAVGRTRQPSADHAAQAGDLRAQRVHRARPAASPPRPRRRARRSARPGRAGRAAWRARSAASGSRCPRPTSSPTTRSGPSTPKSTVRHVTERGGAIRASTGRQPASGG